MFSVYFVRCKEFHWIRSHSEFWPACVDSFENCYFFFNFETLKRNQTRWFEGCFIRQYLLLYLGSKHSNSSTCLNGARIMPNVSMFCLIVIWHLSSGCLYVSFSVSLIYLMLLNNFHVAFPFKTPTLLSGSLNSSHLCSNLPHILSCNMVPHSNSLPVLTSWFPCIYGEVGYVWLSACPPQPAILKVPFGHFPSYIQTYEIPYDDFTRIKQMEFHFAHFNLEWLNGTLQFTSPWNVGFHFVILKKLFAPCDGTWHDQLTILIFYFVNLHLLQNK